jgi:hypothetical protein
MSPALPIVINPLQPECFQLTPYNAPAGSGSGFIPPDAVPNGRFAGGFNTEGDNTSGGMGWNFSSRASLIKTTGRVFKNLSLGVTRNLGFNGNVVFNDRQSGSLLVPVDTVDVNGSDYPVYNVPRDRVEFVLRLWHDKSYSISSVFGGQVADMVSFPLNIEIHAFELYVNKNAEANVIWSEIYNVMLH